MPHAIRIHRAGDADQLCWEAVDIGNPGWGQVRLQQTAVGLNYIDIYMRTGLYPIAEYPAVLGMEAAGYVEAIGEGVDGLAIGDRVAYCTALGAYTESRIIAADKLLKLPTRALMIERQQP